MKSQNNSEVQQTQIIIKKQTYKPAFCIIQTLELLQTLDLNKPYLLSPSMKPLLIFILLIIQTVCFIDYNSNHILVCQNINPNLNYAQSLQTLWNSVILHAIDRIMFLVFTPALLVIQIIFIMVFIKYRQTLFRRQGAIFFAIIVIQTTLNAYYFTYALYVTMNPYGDPMPASFPAFCGIMGIMNQLADSALDIYLFYFIAYTFLNMKTSIKAKPVLNKKVLHSSVAILSIGWILFIVFDQRLTINEFGLCGFSSLRYNTIQWFFPTFTILSNLAYLGFALYTYYYFKKHMPVNQTLVERLYHENKSISYFVAVYSILIMLFNVSVGVVYFNCFRNNPLPQLLTFATMMNVSRILQTIFLLYFIMTDQTIKKKTKKFLRSFFQPKMTEHSAFGLQLKDIDFSQPGYEDLDITLKQKILELKEEQHEIDLYKIAQIATIISGICVCHLQYFNTKTFTSSIRTIHFKEKITFQIEPKTLSDYNIDVHKLPKADILKGTITMVAPRIFSKLLQVDRLTYVQKSFDLAKNYHKMYNIAEGKGGKSGQFFFFSSDNKYVLKTVTKDEFTFIAQNLEEFFEYYQKNPQTLLAKIYGLYTIRGDDIGRQYDLILMKNVFGCQKKQVLRTYDIKGSKHDRQVINEKQIYNQLESLTLKDTDFIKLEGKLHISRQKIRNLRAILRKDTLFLKNFNLIDYSLLIIRVKWTEKPDNQNFWNEYQRMQSSLNPNEFYHIGIIDYMQAWNISKKSQNWFKSLMGKKGISSQEPNFYQRRFIQFVEQITFFPEEELDQTVSDFTDQSSEVNNQQSGRKMTPSKSSLKVLELSSSSPTFSRMEKRESKMSKIELNEKQIMIPYEISQIKRKSSVNDSEYNNSFMQAHLSKRSESFNRKRKTGEILSPKKAESFNQSRINFSGQERHVTFKGVDFKLDQIDETNQNNEMHSQRQSKQLNQ